MLAQEHVWGNGSWLGRWCGAAALLAEAEETNHAICCAAISVPICQGFVRWLESAMAAAPAGMAPYRAEQMHTKQLLLALLPQAALLQLLRRGALCRPPAMASQASLPAGGRCRLQEAALGGTATWEAESCRD